MPSDKSPHQGDQMKRISVIIPSKNAQNLMACVAAVRRHEPRMIICVIDDSLNHNAFPKDWWLENEPICCNYGLKPFIYARNCNIGIRASAPDDVILLNDDALLETPGGFRAMQEQQWQHPEYGIIGSSIDNCGTPNQIHKPGNRLRMERTMLVFACVFIPRTTIEMIGLLDERFCVGADGNGPRGYGCEDDDYSWRCRWAGLKLAVYDGCFVNHTTLPSSFRGDPRAAGDVKIHEALFQKKWGIHPRRPVDFL